MNEYDEDAQGMQLTEGFESCRLVSYLDAAGVPTIGWGHTGPDVHLGMVCTQAQADAWLEQDKAAARQAICSFVKVPLTRNEFDALEDFDFNVGRGNFAGSTLLRMINAGDFAGAAAQFERWDRVHGRVIAGLLRRRLAEESLFNRPDIDDVPMV